jgi:hypothetical protein
MQKEAHQYRDIIQFLYHETIMGKGVFTGNAITTERMAGLPAYENSDESIPSLHPKAATYILQENIQELEVAIVRYCILHPETTVTLQQMKEQLQGWAKRHIQLTEGTETIITQTKL